VKRLTWSALGALLAWCADQVIDAAWIWSSLLNMAEARVGP
jgi:hypothetical protein